MKVSENSFVTDLLDMVQLSTGTEAEQAKALRWSADIQSQALTHSHNLQQSALVDGDEQHEPLIRFLTGVGTVAAQITNSIRDKHDMD